MCGRYAVEARIRQRLREAMLFEDLTRDADWQDRYNIPPSMQVPVLRVGAQGGLELVMMTWGFVPSWAKDERPRQCSLATAERVATNGYFRSAFRRQRCLLPATGFYEWQETVAGKQPWFVRSASGTPLLIAGIWDSWNGANRVALITTGPNAVMEPIHDRMPVIIGQSDVERWLRSDYPEALLHPCPDDAIAVCPVSRRVNATRNEGADLIEPIPF